MSIDGGDHCLNIHIPQGRMATDPIQLIWTKRQDPFNGLAAGLIKQVKQEGRGPAFEATLLISIKAIDVKVRRSARSATGDRPGQGEELFFCRYKMRQKVTYLPGWFVVERQLPLLRG